MSETCNGWANRETWAVALWVNNDESLQESCHGMLRDAEVPADDPLRAGELVRDWLDNLFYWDNYGDEHRGQRVVPAFLLSMREEIGSLWRVDWHELGAVLLSDALECEACAPQVSA